MKIFDYARRCPQEVLAVTDDGEKILYKELNELGETLGALVGHRLVFALCRNTPGSLLGYLGLLQSGGVPLLLDADIAAPLLQDLTEQYRPAFCLVPEDLPAELREVLLEGKERERPEQGQQSQQGQQGRQILQIRDYRLFRCAPEGTDPELAPELRLLLTTSGSTGSRKLVRISGENLDANAQSIVQYLQITREDRPITVLPMQYSYGMSILHTHVMMGAPILLTRYTLLEREFWDRVRKEGATSLCGVPYTFEMYNRVGLTRMDLPSLRTVTQAGGKLSEKRHMQYAEWAAQKGIRFCVMYGQTEASPRMGWLPPEKAVEKCGSMGIAIPGGRLELVDENGKLIQGIRTEAEEARGENARRKAGSGGALSVADAEQNSIPSGAEREWKGSDPGGTPVGELVYTGPNVALGYAVCAEDLRKGDEFHGVLHTGDMAWQDADGYFYIVGRRSRFIKIAGKRIGLDEVEKILRTRFPDLDLACAGRDEELELFVNNQTMSETLADCLTRMTGIPGRRIRVVFLPEIPRSSSGKIRYAALKGED